ncbi:MAG: hypothetical protein WC189_02870, partial [Bacilli bacterium]
NDVIKKSYKKGYCIRKVEKGLYYCVFKNERWIDRLSKIKIKKAYSYFLNQEKYQIKSISPLTLIIDDPNHVIDYYKGDFCILIICDISIIEKKLKKAKMIVQIEPADSDYILKITNINNEEFSEEKSLVMKVSVCFFNRFLIECDSLKWFIEELIKRYDYMLNYYANLEKK